jgi:hypothetical protein
MKSQFLDALRMAAHLKNIKRRDVKRQQESILLKTLLAGLRGK